MLEQLDLEVVQHEIDPEVLNNQDDDMALRLLLAQRALPGVRFADPPPFWTNVREQFRLFLCTEDPYFADVRKEFRQRGREATAALIGMLAGAISAAMGGGVVIAVLVPFVSLLLLLASKIGIKAYCAGQARP